MADTKYLWEDTPAGVMCWHIHHDVLLEISTESLAERAAFIREHKPPEEVARRLRAMRPVVGVLPEPVVDAARAYTAAWKAHAEAVKAYTEARKARADAWKPYAEAWKVYGKAVKTYDEARNAHDEAWKAWADARMAYIAMIKAHHSELEALHAAECPDCPWDGKTLFPSSANSL